jgi:hypothetical protein
MVKPLQRFARKRCGGVGAAIEGDDDLKLSARVVEFAKVGDLLRDIALFVVRRDDNRHARGNLRLAILARFHRPLSPHMRRPRVDDQRVAKPMVCDEEQTGPEESLHGAGSH